MGSIFNTDNAGKVVITNQVSVGTITPDASALLDLNSTTLGFLLPRMTTAQRNAIVSPATGLMVFDTNLAQQYCWSGASWTSLGNVSAGANNQVQFNEAGAFAGDSNFIWDNSTKQLEITGTIKVVDGANAAGYVLTSDANGVASWAATGGAVPGGSNTYVQFNNSGSFDGDPNFVWDYTNNRVGIKTPSPATTLDVNGHISIAASSGLMWNASTSGGYIYSGGYGSALYINAPDSGGTSSILVNSYSNSGTGGIKIYTGGPTPLLKISLNPNGDSYFNGYGGVGIGTTSPLSCALLDLTSTTQGFLAPRMTTAEKNLIASAVAGLLVYDSNAAQYNYYNGSSWLPLSNEVTPVKYTVPYTSFTGFGALTGDVQLFVAQPGTVITMVKVKHSAGFVASGQTTCKVSVGVSGNLTKYHPQYEIDNVTNPVGTSTFNVNAAVGAEDQSSTTSIRVSLTSNVNLSGLSSGSVDIWVWKSQAV